VGDACELDTDGDGLSDKFDHCPKNPAINYTDFRNYFEVDLYPDLNAPSTNWEITHDGMEVWQRANTTMAAMLIGLSETDSWSLVSPLSVRQQPVWRRRFLWNVVREHGRRQQLLWLRIRVPEQQEVLRGHVAS
jgi:hypothetical protein